MQAYTAPTLKKTLYNTVLKIRKLHILQRIFENINYYFGVETHTQQKFMYTVALRIIQTLTIAFAFDFYRDLLCMIIGCLIAQIFTQILVRSTLDTLKNREPRALQNTNALLVIYVWTLGNTSLSNSSGLMSERSASAVVVPWRRA